MADAEPEVVEQFHGILACGTLGGRLIKEKTVFSSYEGHRLRLPQVAVRESSFACFPEKRLKGSV